MSAYPAALRGATPTRAPAALPAPSQADYLDGDRLAIPLENLVPMGGAS